MFYAMIASILLAATTGSAWLNVSLGEPVSAVRSDLGDPLSEVDLGDDVTKSLYLVADNSAVLGVDRKNGVVVMISLASAQSQGAVALTDPYGVKLGDSEQHVLTVRGKPDSTDNGDGADRLIYGQSPKWRYVFKDGRLVMLIFATPDSISAPAKAVADPPLHTGRSLADAIIIKGENAFSGVAWEYTYLTFHPCTGDVKRKVVQQALITSGKRSFDALKTVCPGAAPQTIYFDITDYVGKL